MSNRKVVKTWWSAIFEYPHVRVLVFDQPGREDCKSVFSQRKKYPDPMAVLVFDEKYNLMGTLTLKDILKGLEPRFLNRVQRHRLLKRTNHHYLSSGTRSSTRDKRPCESRWAKSWLLQIFCRAGRPCHKAAYLMLHHDSGSATVLEDKKKFVGLVDDRGIRYDIRCSPEGIGGGKWQTKSTSNQKAYHSRRRR